MSATSSGYRGRTGIHELFLVDDTVRNLIHDGAGEQAIEAEIRKHTPEAFSRTVSARC